MLNSTELKTVSTAHKHSNTNKKGSIADVAIISLSYVATLPLGNIHAFVSSADFQNQLFRKFFQEYHRSVKQFGSRAGPTFCWA